jgi:serine/threonine-protein kinase HipA
MSEKKEILVYADWKGLNDSVRMGTLFVTPSRGKEIFSFEYSNEWLKSGFTYSIDPELQLYAGQFFPREEKQNFGVFLDSCPDRWGRVLMERREAALARNEKRPEKKLLESDFLLGVYDGNRMGALRFKLNSSLLRVVKAFDKTLAEFFSEGFEKCFYITLYFLNLRCSF